jgi:hypothetical protein
MSIAKPFTFTANTYAKASEVNADFDVVYSQVNTNISAIAQNATDIDNLENNKADINGSTSQRFAVADAVTNGDAINKQTLFKAIGNTLDYISGLAISKDSGSPEDTIIVSPGSAYDSTKSIVLSLDNSLSKQNTNQAANATYYVYIIGNSTGNSTDILISDSSTTPALPSGYTLFRQIGNYTTDSSNHIYTITNSIASSLASAGVPVIVESFVNGKSGYNIYSNGYCEQWGFDSGGIDSHVVYFPKRFKDTNYNLTFGWYVVSPGGVGNEYYFATDFAAQAFRAQYGGGTSGARWKACGYLY